MLDPRGARMRNEDKSSATRTPDTIDPDCPLLRPRLGLRKPPGPRLGCGEGLPVWRRDALQMRSD